MTAYQECFVPLPRYLQINSDRQTKIKKKTNIELILQAILITKNLSYVLEQKQKALTLEEVSQAFTDCDNLLKMDFYRLCDTTKTLTLKDVSQAISELRQLLTMDLYMLYHTTRSLHYQKVYFRWKKRFVLPFLCTSIYVVY